VRPNPAVCVARTRHGPPGAPASPLVTRLKSRCDTIARMPRAVSLRLAAGFAIATLASCAGGRGGLTTDGTDASAPAGGCGLTVVTDLIPDMEVISGLSYLVSDGKRLYFSDPNTEHLSRLLVNGGTVAPVGLHVFFTVLLSGGFIFGSDIPGNLNKVATDGSSSTTLASGHGADAMATDGNTIFWSEYIGPKNFSDIWSLSLAGGQPRRIVSGRNGEIRSLAVSDQATIVWGEWAAQDPSGGVSIATAKMDGSALRVLSTVAGGGVMTADGSGFYVATRAAITFVPPSGGAPTTLIDGQPGIQAMTTDQANLYWTQEVNCIPEPNIGNGRPICAGQLSSAPKTGAPVSVLAGAGAASVVAVDDACVYWATAAGQFHGTGTVSLRGAPKALVLGIK
jgi:hypothetical protein